MMKRCLLILVVVMTSVAAHAVIAVDGSCTATAVTCTLSGTSTNALQVAMSKSSSVTVPTIASGWTLVKSIATTSTGTTMAVLIACRMSATAATGNFSGSAVSTAAVSISGGPGDASCLKNMQALGIDGLAVCAVAANCFAKGSTTVTARALADSSGAGTSWFFQFLAASGSSVCAPSGMAQRSATGTVAINDTNGTATSWPVTTATCTVTSETWISFTFEALAASPACSSCAPKPIYKSTHGLNTANTTRNELRFPPVSSGLTAIVAGTMSGSGTSGSGAVPIVTDDANNAYTVVTCGDATDNQSVFFAFATNIATNAGPTKITVSYTNGPGGTGSAVALDLFLFKDVATANALAVRDCNANDKGVGNLAYSAGTISSNAAVTPTAAGSLVLQISQVDAWSAQGTSPLVYTAGAGMSGLDWNDFDGISVQWGTHAASSFTPTHTVVNGTGGTITGAVVLTIVLNPATSGTDFDSTKAIVRGVHVPDSNVDSPAGMPVTCCSATSVNFQNPSICASVCGYVYFWQGNISKEPAVGGVTMTNPSNTLAFIGRVQQASLVSEYVAYGAFNSTGNSSTTAFHFAPTTAFNFGMTLYEVEGASALDTSGTGSGWCSATNTLNAVSGLVTGQSCTASTTTGVMVGVMQEVSDCSSAVSIGTFSLTTNACVAPGDGYAAQSADQDGGGVIFWPGDTAAHQFNWTFVTNSSGSNVGDWWTGIVIVKGPAAASNGGAYKRKKLLELSFDPGAR